jgi:hypothetical protein
MTDGPQVLLKSVTHRNTRVPGGRHGYAFSQVGGPFEALTSTFRNAPCALTRRRPGVQVPQRPRQSTWSVLVSGGSGGESGFRVPLRSAFGSVRDRDVRAAFKGSVSSASREAELAFASEVVRVKSPRQAPLLRSGEADRRPQVRDPRRLRVSPERTCKAGVAQGVRLATADAATQGQLDGSHAVEARSPIR